MLQGRTIRNAIAAILLLAALPAAAAPNQAGAIVEDLQGNVAGVQPFDTLDPGRTITLPPGASIVLGYMRACTRETVTGGKVTVGEDASTVTGGKVTTEKLNCSGALQLSSSQAGKSGAMVFRRGPGTGKGREGLPEPSVIVQFTAPAFSLTGSGELVIDRLDQPETARRFMVSGNLFDLAKSGVRLHAGGTYQATLNGHSVVFRLTADAADGGGPLLLRLVRI